MPDRTGSLIQINAAVRQGVPEILCVSRLDLQPEHFLVTGISALRRHDHPNCLRPPPDPYETNRGQAPGPRRHRTLAAAQGRIVAMLTFNDKGEPFAWGSWEDAEALRRWSFERRTPEQRLAWLVSALELAYANGALKPRRPDTESTASNPRA